MCGPGTTNRRSHACLAVTVASLKAWIEAIIVSVDISGSSVVKGRAEGSGESSSSSKPYPPWKQHLEGTTGNCRLDAESTRSPELRMEEPSRSENSPLNQVRDRREPTKPVSRTVGEGWVRSSLLPMVKPRPTTRTTSRRSSGRRNAEETPRECKGEEPPFAIITNFPNFQKFLIGPRIFPI
ncbi:hypothetical protein VNO77_08429 [Canavalia gladiata]|uniref:Uncharacterized protein n=1 Tax=Canavalia gladiata TaxID=3824 RepID=A0AAN9ME14_CANGL